jgi:GNAT superfamily N-acetyltransferase
MWRTPWGHRRSDACKLSSVAPWSSVSVRPAESTDADALLSLASSFATSFTVVAEQFGSQLGAVLSDPASVLSVAVTEAEVVGYVAASLHPTLYANGPVGWIEELMVHPTHRRGGVGQLLVSTVERWAESRGAVMVSLATRRAVEFWSAVGYEASATYFRKVL